MGIAERFEAKVDRSGEHHLWTGARLADGSGAIKVDGKLTTAKRVAWELEYGPLSARAQVVSCPVEPSCVRVDHLSVRNVKSGRQSRVRRREAMGPSARSGRVCGRRRSALDATRTDLLAG